MSINPTYMRISYSRLREWLTCRWRYNLSYREYYKPIGLPSEGLRDGSAFHKMMEVFYRPGQTKFPTMATLRKKFDKMEILEQDRERAWHWVEAYADQAIRAQVQEPDLVILSEFPFSVRLDEKYLKQHGVRMTIDFVGIIDLIAIRRKKVELWDHKVLSNLPSANMLDHATISFPQTGLYPWASRRLGFPIERAIINCMGKRKAGGTLARFPVDIPEYEAEMWGKWLHDRAIEMATAPEILGKNLGSLACDWCEFRYPCYKHQAEGSGGLNRALASGFSNEGTPYKRDWQTKFPAAAIKKMQETIK